MANKYFPYLESWYVDGAVSTETALLMGALSACAVLAVLGRLWGRGGRSASDRLSAPVMVVAGLLLLYGFLHPLFGRFGFDPSLGPRLGTLGALAALVGMVAPDLLAYSSRRSRVFGILVLLAAALGSAGVLVPGYPSGLVVAAVSAFSVLMLLLEAALRGRGDGPRVLGPALCALLVGGTVWIPEEVNLPIPLSVVQGAGLCAALLFRRKERSAAAPSEGEAESPAAVNGGTAEQVAEEAPLLSDQVDRVSLALTRFIPKEFLAILDRASVMDLQLGDHVKREMTIFFSDIRQFTNLSEKLTPEESFKFINSYLSRIVPVITASGGFVDKYMGDAVMALFANAGGADSAVRAAIEMQKKLVEYNGHRASCGYRSLSMGIGLHTGTLMLGVVGVEDRMQNTVVSDAVNLASRLESITKVFNISLAISEETFKNLEDPGAYMYRFIGKVRVKGKAEPVSVFEIFDGIDAGTLERKMKANIFFEQGMLSYYRKEFTEAMYNFRKVLETLPEDGASTFYLDNCMVKVRA